jgi:hypothetical protein
MYNQGIDINRYSAYDAFPEMCMTCKSIDAVSKSSALCPNTTEFKQFIEVAAKRFMPKNFELNTL